MQGSTHCTCIQVAVRTSQQNEQTRYKTGVYTQAAIATINPYRCKLNTQATAGSESFSGMIAQWWIKLLGQPGKA